LDGSDVLRRSNNIQFDFRQLSITITSPPTQMTVTVIRVMVVQ